MAFVFYPDPFLRKRAQEVSEVTPETRKLIEEMVQIMRERNGVGLAAPQVGRSLRLFISAEIDEKEESSPDQIAVFINPILSQPSRKSWSRQEGCLSIPGVVGEVVRPWEITVDALDLAGHPFRRRFSGLMARVMMHENDHLNGVLFIDRMHPKERRQIETQLRTLRGSQEKVSDSR